MSAQSPYLAASPPSTTATGRHHHRGHAVSQTTARSSLDNEADLQRALARLWSLWGAAAGTPEAAELEVLADAIEAYEAVLLAAEAGR